MSIALVIHVLMILAVVIAAGSLVMTLINLGYYRAREGGGAMTDEPLVSVCIPARNEERNLESIVRSALSTGYERVEVLVYDDQSTDGTGRILSALAGSDARVRAVATSPLPSGWVGKQWACERLGRSAQGAWLLFTDADVRFHPGAIRAALGAALEHRAAMVSTFPRQVTLSLGERLLVPMIHFILFSYLPMGRMRGSNDPGACAGCGQFLFVQREAWAGIGGHAAWKDSMHDGIRMPRALRRAGFHTDLFDGTGVVSCRMYEGFGSTWRGFAKNAFEGLGSVALLVVLTLLHAIGHVGPWLVIGGAVVVPLLRGPVLILAAAAAVLALSQRVVLARRFEQRLLGALLHPVGVVLMTLIQWHSLWISRRGGRTWRGRSFSPRPASPSDR